MCLRCLISVGIINIFHSLILRVPSTTRVFQGLTFRVACFGFFAVFDMHFSVQTSYILIVSDPYQNLEECLNVVNNGCLVNG